MPQPGFIQASSLSNTALLVGSDGRGFIWSADSTLRPVEIDRSTLGDADIVRLVGGNSMTYALTSDGRVYAWGSNTRGELGNGTTTPGIAPVPVAAPLTGKTVVSIAAGYASGYALTSDGEVYAWGDNASGQLGDGTTMNRPTPVLVAGALAGKDVTQLTAGRATAYALTSDGEVYAWGANHYGHLGNGTTVNSFVPVAVNMTAALAGKTVEQIEAGFDFALVRTTDGLVYGWGLNYHGQLGSAAPTGGLTANPDPLQVPLDGALSGLTVTSIAAGDYTAYAIGSDGRAYAWGDGRYGALGRGGALVTSGTTANSDSPVAVDTTGVLSGKTVKRIADGGNDFTFLVTTDDHVYAWGRNASGQLGDGTTTSSTIPVATDMTGALDDYAHNSDIPAVTVGGVPATNVTISGCTVTFTAPPHTAGTYDVIITFWNGNARTYALTYTPEASQSSVPFAPNTGVTSERSGNSVAGLGVVLIAAAALGFGFHRKAARAARSTR